MGSADALLLGPGLGREEETAEFLRGLLRADHRAKKGSLGFLARGLREEAPEPERNLPPLIVDADGLNLLSEVEDWWHLIPEGTILTPHPGEMSRLTGMSHEDILADRVGVATSCAAKWHCVVVLKGAHTVVAAPDGHTTIMPFASDALATGGTGDVLAGAIAGLAAQGLAPFEAAVAGAYVHGLAGILLARRSTSRSVLAGDVMRALGDALAVLE
jgi:NAD(P)H-hydrate epimerase